MIGLLGAVLWLVVAGWATGGWLRQQQDDVPSGFALTTLAGLCGLAAALPNLFLLGLPRPVVLALGVLAAAGGLVCHVRHREPVQGWSLLALLVVLVLLASPLMLAMDTPLLRFDAVATWWPKVQEVASGQAPTLDPATAEGLHVHPEYPRGSAWLASLAAPFGALDSRWLKLSTLLFTVLVAVAMFEWARGRGRPLAGLVAAIIFVGLPEVALWSHSGYVDLPLAGAVLVVAAGLTARRDRGGGGAGVAWAVVGAAGAASLKQEGAVLLALVVGLCVLDLLRGRLSPRAATVPLVGLLVVLPWWLARAGGPGEVLGPSGTVLGSPALLLARGAAVVEGLADYLVDPANLRAGAAKEALPEEEITDPWAFRLVLVSLLLLVPRGRAGISVLPIVALLTAVVAIYVVTPHGIHWHLHTAFPRLVLQVLPLALLAAAERLAGGPRAPASPAPAG